MLATVGLGRGAGIPLVGRAPVGPGEKAYMVHAVQSVARFTGLCRLLSLASWPSFNPTTVRSPYSHWTATAPLGGGSGEAVAGPGELQGVLRLLGVLVLAAAIATPRPMALSLVTPG